MPDPFSTIITAGAAGGLAGKFIEKAWDSSERWLATYFKDHGEALQANAEANSKEFINLLAKKISALEEETSVTKNILDQAQEDPSFGALLQKALIGSAQTNSNEKHELLSRLVSERLTKPSDSILSLASQSACEAMTHLTINQLHILGCLTTLLLIRPSFTNTQTFLNRDTYIQLANHWLSLRFSPFSNLTISSLDILHLEAVSCIRSLGIAIMDLDAVLKSNLGCGEYAIATSDLNQTDIGKKVIGLWEHGLQSVSPTSIGQLIGVYVTDMLSKGKTDMNNWV